MSSTGGERIIERLVIGVPTVRRPFDYLPATMRSLIDGLSPVDRERVRIILVNADASPHQHHAVARVAREYEQEIEEGLLRIVEAPAYPRGPGEEERPDWHRKQTWDAAATFALCAAEGSHYMAMEDDIIAVPGYLPVIEAWLQTCRENAWTGVPWFVRVAMSYPPIPYPADKFFGTYGFVLTADEARALATYMRERLGEDPSDVIVRRWLVEQERDLYIREPSIFQHIGAISSEEGQFEWIESGEFAGAKPKPGMDSLREAWAAARISPMNGPRILLRRFLPPRAKRWMHRVASLEWKFRAWRNRRRKN